MAFDIDLLRTWIGKSEAHSDQVTATAVASLAATGNSLSASLDCRFTVLAERTESRRELTERIISRRQRQGGDHPVPELRPLGEFCQAGCLSSETGCSNRDRERSSNA